MDEQAMFQIRVAQDASHPAKTLTFTAENIQPLGYAELAGAKLHEKLTIPIQLNNSKLVYTDVEVLDKNKTYGVKTTLESTFTSRAIGLVKGGWLPGALAVTLNTTIFIDRNIVSLIISRFSGGKTVGAEPDFLDLIADRPVRINPLFFAMEGNTRSIPTPDLVRDQLKEVGPKLQAALPSAKLLVSSDHLKGALGLIEDCRPGMAQKQQFLMRLAPSLTAPVSKRNMQQRRDEVLAAADECGVPRRSLVALAALSSVFVLNGKSPAKKLLKFKVGYCEEDAYNALVDLRSLELLIQVFAFFPRVPALLCTADKNLALFWTGIRASNFERKGGRTTCDFNPVEELFAGSTVDEWGACIGATQASADNRTINSPAPL